MKKEILIEITGEIKNRIGIHNYADLPGTRKENILCTLFVVLGSENVPLTAENFLMMYNWLVGTMYQGMIIDFSKHPTIRGTNLYKEACSLKGDATENLINRESCMKIAKFIFNNEAFNKELDFCYTNFEVSHILFSFSFSPACSI